MAFSDNLHDLEHLISDAMGNAFEGARRVLAEQLQRRSESGLREAREGSFRELRDATARLDAARTQADVLTALLEESGRFASRTALLLTFADGARGWAAFGFADRAQGIEDLRLDYDGAGLARLAAGRGAVTLTADEGATLAKHFGGAAPNAAVLVPLVLRDRIAATLYADQARTTDAFVPIALQLLVYSAAQLLEAQGARERAATPTLAGLGAGDTATGLPLWDPAAFEAAGEPAAPATAAAPPSAAPAATTARAVAEPAPAPPALEPAPWEAPEAPPAEAPAPWDEEQEEATWSAPEAAPVEVAPAAPAWQPSWQMEEAPAPAPAAAEPPAPEVAAEEAWVYTDQGYEGEQPYEAEPTFEGAAVEEVPAEAALEEPDVFAQEELEAAPIEEGVAVEEVAAETIGEVVPEADVVPEVVPEATWDEPTAAHRLQSPESATSPLYGAPLYPSEATVRISRDMLPGAMPAAPPAPPPSDVSEDRTVRLQRPAVPPPVAPAPPVEETPARGRSAVFPSGGGAGTTEVQPPPDLEGPGWAFRGGDTSTASYRQQTEESSGLHEEARRLARLLVSEIKLYNEEQIEEGRRHRDIYPRLQEDIDRSRQMYEERVDAGVRGEVDYFQQELVNILAGGDAGALGM